MANKEAVFSLRVDTGKSVSEISAFDKGLQDANKSAQNLDNTITDVNATFEQVYGELQPLTTRLGEAEDRLYELALAGDTTSQQYKELLETVSRYRRTQIETDMVVDQASKTFGEKLAGGVGTATELFSGFESATALLGVESEQLVQTMVKLQAVQGLAAAVSEIQIKIKEKDALFTGIQTAAQKTYAFAVGESTGAMKVFRTALLATGVGALIVLIGALIANFDDLKAAIFGTNEAADAMKETMDAYKQGAQGAIESTTQVGNAFELAKQGVISKEEALYTYNETLGDTFGRATNLNEAEQLYIKKKEAFIAATAARAQAQALFAKAAEESANALTAQFEDQTNILQKTAAGLTSYFFGVKAGADQLITSQKKEVAEAEKTSKRKAKVYEDAGKAKLKEAETTENANGIISENEKKTQDAIAAKRKEAAEKAKKLREEQLKAAKEAWEKEKELSLKYAEELTKIIENRVKKEDEIIRTSQMTKAEWAAKEAERINKLREDEFKDAQGYLEAELISNQNNFEARKQLLELQREQELSNKELTEGEITAIEAKYAEQRKAIQEEERNLRIQAVQNTLTTISNLAQLFAGGSEKQQRKAFQVQKAVSIAQATIDTYKAAQAAYASLAGVPVVGPVLGAAAAAAAVSAGLLNVKNIASQKFEGGGSTGGAASTPNIGSAGATAGQLGGNAANANLNTQQQNTAELIGQSNEGTPVYVLESDITGTQNKVAMQNKLSVW